MAGLKHRFGPQRGVGSGSSHPRSRFRGNFPNPLRTQSALGSLKIPGINVGNRNAQRMNGGNVVTVPAEVAQIKEAALNILFDGKTADKLKSCKQVYGDGNAAKRMVKILKDSDKSRTELLAKDITY